MRLVATNPHSDFSNAIHTVGRRSRSDQRRNFQNRFPKQKYLSAKNMRSLSPLHVLCLRHFQNGSLNSFGRWRNVLYLDWEIVRNQFRHNAYCCGTSTNGTYDRFLFTPRISMFRIVESSPFVAARAEFPELRSESRGVNQFLNRLHRYLGIPWKSQINQTGK